MGRRKNIWFSECISRKILSRRKFFWYLNGDQKGESKFTRKWSRKGGEEPCRENGMLRDPLCNVSKVSWGPESRPVWPQHPKQLVHGAGQSWKGVCVWWCPTNPNCGPLCRSPSAFWKGFQVRWHGEWIQNESCECLVSMKPHSRHSIKVRVIVLQDWSRLPSLWHSGKALRLQPSGKPTTPSLLRSFSQHTARAPTNCLSRLFQILCQGQWGSSSLVSLPNKPLCVLSELQLKAPFPDLCQITFYLIPGVLPCWEGCGYDPEARQTHRGETD